MKGKFCLLAGILALFTLSLHAQTLSYEASWKKVMALINERGLPQSALAEVKKIYARAKKEGNSAQLVKALVYSISLQAENREENVSSSIRELDKELTAAKEPVASLLKSLQASLYWQYFQQHRYQLYERTNTTGFDKTDLGTWTADDLHKKIGQLYLQSIANESLLQQTSLSAYEPILIRGNTRALRPTLYDLLAHEALDYFKNDERTLTRPTYAFQIDQPDVFAPAKVFVKANFATKDSLSLQNKALQVYQRLIGFHLTDKSAAALIDVDLERIAWVYQVSVSENKDSLYEQALVSVINTFQNQPGTHQARYLLGSLYNEQADRYASNKDSGFRYDRVLARSIVESVVKDSNLKDEGWVNSFNLLTSIERPEYSFELEQVNLPEKPFRSLIRFRNLTQLHFRLIKSSQELRDQMDTDQEAWWNTLLKTTPLRAWSQALPDTKDYLDHAAEIKIDSLPIGQYILIGSSDAAWDKKNSILGAQPFHVSNISYAEQGNRLFVLHRETGKPLEGAEIKLINRQYDYKTYKYTRKLVATYKSDKNGFASTGKKRDVNNYGLTYEIAWKGDYLATNTISYSYDYYTNSPPDTGRRRLFFFTDRSLYRPGQVVYFKGIATNEKGKKTTIAAGYKTKIYLVDANDEEVDSLVLTTNEFGSLNGSFTLPQNQLNGSFSIADEDRDNSISFFVEEYKRPKFQVSFNEIIESYKVNDTIQLSGEAKAYAGNVVDKAKVTYRVVRKARFMYPWLTYKWWLPPASPQEIAHGETTTDKEGRFRFTFTALPDRKVNRQLDPLFDYEVNTAITDINGETRSGTTTVTAGYTSLILGAQLPERLPADSFTKLIVTTENLNGVHQKAQVTLTITSLLPEQRLIRKRYWQQPDTFVYSKQEFLRYFPLDEYRNESEMQTWPLGSRVYSVTDTSSSSGVWSLPNTRLKPGFYELQLQAKDQEGHPVKEVKYIELYDPNSNGLARPEYLWTRASDPVEPGEEAQILVGTSASDVFLVEEKSRSKEEKSLQFYSLSREKKAFAYAATEADRGGYGIGYFFIKDNRFYSFNDIITVPWSNKELSVAFSTFRDKTLPGSQEQWKVKISGYKNEKVAAEMLASMYDASLDQFQPHNWYKPSIWPSYSQEASWSAITFTSVRSNMRYSEFPYRSFEKNYDQFIFGNTQPNPIYAGVARNLQGRAKGLQVQEMKMAAPTSAAGMPGIYGSRAADSAVLNDVVVTGYGTSRKENNEPAKPSEAILIRKNFNETAFFFPDLKTDAEGSITFSFTAPEALTRWKLQTLAHSKELAFGLNSKELVTQKELMVQPNAPRFLRQGDHMEFTAKIVNLTDSEFTGQAQLELFDATTSQSVDGWFMNTFPNQYFTVGARQSEVVKFPIQVPFTFNNALVWRVTARSGNLSDGEESSLPVLTNKLLVTETLPLPMRGSGTKNFTFEKLKQSGESETLQSQSLVFEYTSNPAWYAVQALPYLMEYPYECAEQTWNRYYANALASRIANSSPRIRQVFEKWKNADTAALTSALQKNQELKSVLLEETPWVLQAKNETQQRKNLALLFDMVRMTNESKTNLEKLRQMQSENGGFVWFKGGPDDRYITQYIVSGMGHLKKLGVPVADEMMLKEALAYLDLKIKEDYDRLVRSKANLKEQQVSFTEVQYLYMRSFFPEAAVPAASATAVSYFRQQSRQYWTKQNKYMQGMIALALSRSGDATTATAILKSLKESSITDPEMGMYWKDNTFGRSWFWYHAPIETQALLIEAFQEAGRDLKTVDDLKTWLLKNKQTNNWHTTKATAEACYALLLQGTDWLAGDATVQIKAGSLSISSATEESVAGTGYFKKRLDGSFIKPDMGTISVTVKQPLDQKTGQAGAAPSWGAVYWQYFEDMDKITSAATPLQLTKKLFVEKNTDQGPVLQPISAAAPVHVGDKIKVRIELRVDRDMEYVHMKDLRASALEPTNVLSGYKWQGGLGYYESTKDASTNFFFNYLSKGTYVFEYALYASHAGEFSNGITSIQCLYAPEFAAHSEGIRLFVEE